MSQNVYFHARFADFFLYSSTQIFFIFSYGSTFTLRKKRFAFKTFFSSFSQFLQKKNSFSGAFPKWRKQTVNCSFTELESVEPFWTFYDTTKIFLLPLLLFTLHNYRFLKIYFFYCMNNYVRWFLSMHFCDYFWGFACAICQSLKSPSQLFSFLLSFFWWLGKNTFASLLFSPRRCEALYLVADLCQPSE